MSLSVMRSYHGIMIAALGLAGPALAQDAKDPYPRMAPIDQYLMDRNAEIALATSAAPAAISRDATVLVLGRTGYETAREGKNGFVCAVERSWQAPFDDPGFWNPKTRGAICYNPIAAKSVVPATAKRQQWILAGLTKVQVIDHLKTAFANGELHAPASGSMSYMLAKGAHLNNDTNMAHLMFYVPLTDAGAFGHDRPFYVSQDSVNRVSILIVPMSKWSDGSSTSSDATVATTPAS
jgi:hypothetical protein